MIFHLSRLYRRTPILFGYFIIGLGLSSVGSQALATEQDMSRRHSLIHRPGTDSTRPSQPRDTAFFSPGTGIIDQPTVRTSVAPTERVAPATATALAPLTLHRKLTKRPGRDNAPAPVATLQPFRPAIPQGTPPVQVAPIGSTAQASMAGTSLTPLATLPNSTTVPLSGMASRNVAAAAPTSSTALPMASASPSQPLASAGTGSASRHGGSRSALNLLQNKAIVGLLQPAPPSVTPPSTPPPSTPPSTPPPSNPPPSSPPPPPPSPPTSGSATLSWALGSEPDLAGYKVYVGTSSGVYGFPGSPFNAGRVNTYTVSNLPAGQTYFFALAAYDNAGNDSPLSAEVSKSIY